MDSFSPLYHIGLVSETAHLSFSELTKVSAALQKQIMRDFTPIWGIQSTLDAFEKLEDIPLDYWPMIVRNDIDVPGAEGIHEDKDGHPFALVKYSHEWSLTASHECLEMLCNPSGNRVEAGESPIPGQGRVEFLVEVCDPCGAEQFAYDVNGIMVSDFYTPHYFDPVAASGVRYSHTDAIKKPLTVREGGFLSWRDPRTNLWFQEQFFSQKPEVKELGKPTEFNVNIRSMVYEKTPEALKSKTSQEILESKINSIRLSYEQAGEARSTRAKMLYTEINNLIKKK